MKEQQSIKIRGLNKAAHQHIVEQAKRSNLSVNKYIQQKLELIANGCRNNRYKQREGTN